MMKRRNQIPAWRLRSESALRYQPLTRLRRTTFSGLSAGSLSSSWRFNRMNNTQNHSEPQVNSSPPELALPTAEEVFDKPYPPSPPLPPAWTGNSIAVELADRECARLIANQLSDPPIHEIEIDKYARRFNVSKREAEFEIRGQRHGS